MSQIICYIVAIVLFGLAGFNVQAGVRWEWLAFAALVLSQVVGVLVVLSLTTYYLLPTTYVLY